MWTGFAGFVKTVHVNAKVLKRNFSFLSWIYGTVRFPGYDYVLPAYDSADAILSVYFCVVDVFSTAKKENR